VHLLGNGVVFPLLLIFLGTFGAPGRAGQLLNDWDFLCLGWDLQNLVALPILGSFCDSPGHLQ
jgi:hypothetical protein